MIIVIADNKAKKTETVLAGNFTVIFLMSIDMRIGERSCQNTGKLINKDFSR